MVALYLAPRALPVWAPEATQISVVLVLLALMYLAYRPSKAKVVLLSLATLAPVYFFCPYCTDWDIWAWW